MEIVKIKQLKSGNKIHHLLLEIVSSMSETIAICLLTKEKRFSISFFVVGNENIHFHILRRTVVQLTVLSEENTEIFASTFGRNCTLYRQGKQPPAFPKYIRQ